MEPGTYPEPTPAHPAPARPPEAHEARRCSHHRSGECGGQRCGQTWLRDTLNFQPLPLEANPGPSLPLFVQPERRRGKRARRKELRTERRWQRPLPGLRRGRSPRVSGRGVPRVPTCRYAVTGAGFTPRWRGRPVGCWEQHPPPPTPTLRNGEGEKHGGGGRNGGGKEGKGKKKCRRAKNLTRPLPASKFF